MNSLQIQYFLTVAEQKSFTEAARILFITQPAISKQIRLLEQELGAVLFERGKKTVCLTFAGQAFYDYFTQCNFQLELLQKHLEQKKKKRPYPSAFFLPGGPGSCSTSQPSWIRWNRAKEFSSTTAGAVSVRFLPSAA